MMISVESEMGRAQELLPGEDGLYRVPLTWRYTLPKGLVLDDLLKAQGLIYVRRPPGEMYELWVLGASVAQGVEGYTSQSTVVHGPPTGFISPTF